MAIVSSIVYEIIIFYLASTYSTLIDPVWVRDRASRDANRKGLPATLEGEGGLFRRASSRKKNRMTK